MAGAITAQLPDKPFFLEAASGDTALSYDAEDFRRMVGGIWPRTGICTPTSFRITQSPVVGWSITVGTGYCVVGNTISEVSRYLVHNAASQTINVSTFDTSPPATRTHKVWLGVYDKLLSGTEYAAKIIITEDVGSGAPIPSVPAYYIQLGSFTISPGQSNIQNAQITNSIRHAAMGPSPVPLTLITNIADASGDINTAVPAVIYANGTCKLQGAFKRTSGNPFDGEGIYNLAQLNPEHRPATVKYMVGAGTVNHNADGDRTFFYRVTVFTTGIIRADLPTAYEPLNLMIDGLQYEID